MAREATHPAPGIDATGDEMTEGDGVASSAAVRLAPAKRGELGANQVAGGGTARSNRCGVKGHNTTPGRNNVDLRMVQNLMFTNGQCLRYRRCRRPGILPGETPPTTTGVIGGSAAGSGG